MISWHEASENPPPADEDPAPAAIPEALKGERKNNETGFHTNVRTLRVWKKKTKMLFLEKYLVATPHFETAHIDGKAEMMN